jgi:hypothetical protein
MVSTMIDSIHCRVDRGEKSLPILDEVYVIWVIF